jgi:hypothetical protein
MHTVERQNKRDRLGQEREVSNQGWRAGWAWHGATPFRQGRGAQTLARRADPAQTSGAREIARETAANWSGRGDSNPRLQLGKLSYYPYTTAAQLPSFFYSTRTGRPQGPPCAPRAHESPQIARAMKGVLFPAGLADPDDSRSFHHRRFLLPVREIGRLCAVGVDPRELLAIAIEDGDLPVAVLASLVFAELRALSLLQGCSPTRPQHYADFAALAQVPS